MPLPDDYPQDDEPEHPDDRGDRLYHMFAEMSDAELAAFGPGTAASRALDLRRAFRWREGAEPKED